MKKIALLNLIIVLAVNCSAFTFTPQEKDGWGRLDKICHFTEHALFSSYFYLSDRQEWSPEKYWQVVTYSFMSSITVGATYETVGGFFPKGIDGFSPRDFIADIGGSALGTGLTFWLAKNGSPALHKITLKYRQNGWLRMASSGLICGLNYAMERISQPTSCISDENLFWYAWLSILGPDITLTLNQILFFPKKDNIYWKNLAFDAFGGLVGVIIAKQFAEYNPKISGKISWIWQLEW